MLIFFSKLVLSIIVYCCISLSICFSKHQVKCVSLEYDSICNLNVLYIYICLSSLEWLRRASDLNGLLWSIVIKFSFGSHHKLGNVPLSVKTIWILTSGFSDTYFFGPSLLWLCWFVNSWIQLPLPQWPDKRNSFSRKDWLNCIWGWGPLTDSRLQKFCYLCYIHELLFS